MGIDEVADIINKISEGFEEACLNCLDDKRGIIILAVTEQLYSGQDGEANYLDPTYDNDPFFDEKGTWHNRAKDYKAWKNAITPPEASPMLGLSPRPENVPNLFIKGIFYSEINAFKRGDAIVVDPGNGNGPAIVSKYGEEILNMGPIAVEFFNEEYMLPAIDSFFKECGYR